MIFKQGIGDKMAKKTKSKQIKKQNNKKDTKKKGQSENKTKKAVLKRETVKKKPVRKVETKKVSKSKEVKKANKKEKEVKKVKKKKEDVIKKQDSSPASNDKEFVIFTKFVKNYAYEGSPIGTFYPGEILKAPKEICGDLKRRGWVSTPMHTNHAYLLEVVNTGHYALAMRITTYIPESVKDLFKKFAIREGVLRIDDVFAKEMFSEFLRKYIVFRNIYMTFFEDRRNLPIHVFLSKCRDAGLPPAFTTTMLSVLEEEGYIGRDKAEFKPFYALEDIPTTNFS